MTNCEKFPYLQTALEDHLLIKALQSGEQAAFRRLVEGWKGKVYRTCLHFVPVREDAEDIAQEVFIQVWKSAGNFRGESSLNTWIYRIAVNQCLEHIRKAGRQKRAAAITRLQDLKPGDVPHAAGAFDHPGYTLEQQERAAILHAAISRLNENQRTALTLCEFEQLSYAEIAAVMQVSVSSVESLIFRAKGNLRKELETFYKHRMI